MDIHNAYDYPRRRTSSLAAAAAAAARLQTPSLTSTTSRTSTTSMLTSGGVESARGSATIVAGDSTPPLIDLDDAETYRGADTGLVPKRALAYEAGAGVTATDKLRTLLRQMEGEVRAVGTTPHHQPAGARAPPNTLRRSVQRASTPPPIDEAEDDYSPPTPPPRLSNTYMYSRRAMERRGSDDRQSQSRSPSPPVPRRLPSRAIALRAAAQAASAAAADPEPAPQRDHRPSPLQSYIASHPDTYPEPSSSRTRLDSTPRPQSPSSRKGKERADYVDSRESLPSRAAYEEEQSVDETEDDYYPEYEEASPPRRRGLAGRSLVVEAPPDTSAAFAEGLDAAGNEYDLEEDSVVPWREEDTADSLDSGSGRRQRFLAAEERSHARSRDQLTSQSVHTSGSLSFATAPSIRPRPSAADVSLPPIPEPESSDEEDARAIRRREQLLRPFSSRESTESPRHSLSQSKATTYLEPRSRRTEVDEPSRYDTARDSARFDALTHSMVNGSRGPVRDPLDRSALREISAAQKESLREIANGSLRDTSDLHGDDDIGESESPLKDSPPKSQERGERELLRRSVSPKYGLRQTSQSPALDDSDTLPLADRSRQAPVGRSSLRGSVSPRATLSKSNTRWTPEAAEEPLAPEDSWSPEAQVHSTPARPRWSPEVERRQLERTPPREEPAREERDATPPRAAHAPSTSPQSTPPVSTLGPKSRPAAAPAPVTPIPAVPVTPAHLKGLKTPRPPGAWGTPVPKAARPAREPVPVPSTPAGVPATPAHIKEMKTPRPPGAWGTPIPKAAAPAPQPKESKPAVQVAESKPTVPRPPAFISGLPGTPTPAPNRTLSGMPTPRPPGAWYNSPAQLGQRNVPTQFSSLRNEVLPDSSVSSTGSASTGDVSFHRLRSPKRSPQRKEPTSPTAERGLLVPVLRSPKRSPVWSSPGRRVSSGAAPSSPVTPTKSPQPAHIADESFGGMDPDASWAARLQRVVMSPIRRPPPSKAVADAQQALDAASKASAVARSKVEDAQRAWLDALASVPDEPSRVVQVAKKGWTWGRILLLATLEVVLLWFVFRVTLDYATSSRLLSAFDPWGPQFASSLNIPVPAGLQAFAARPTTPSNLFDLLDMLGITGRPGGVAVVRPPT